MLRYKTVLSLVLMLFIQLMFISFVEAQSVTLAVSDSFGFPGGTVSVEITLDKGGEPVSAVATDIVFFIRILSNPRAVINSQIGPGTDTDRQLISSEPEPSGPSPISVRIFRIGIIPASFTPQSLQATIPDGLVATVTFDISSDATPCIMTTLTNTPSASTAAGQALPTAGRDGTVEVRLVGDFNGDGKVWTDDFSLFVPQFGQIADGFGFDLIYDLNGDGKVWTEDFGIFVAQFGKTCGTGKTVVGFPPVGKNQDAQLSVSIQTSTTPLSSESTEFAIDLCLKNATELRGYGLTLDYDPEVLEFLDATPGKGNLLNKAGGFTPLFLVVSNPDRPGQVWIANAISDSKMAKGDGLLASLSFRTHGKLSGSSLPISLSAVELFDAQLHLNSVSAENLMKQTQLVPEQNRLAQNYPNPFNTVTCINYQLAQPAFVALKVYNLSGQLVRTLVGEEKPPSWYSVRWDGRDNLGRDVASGIYLYRLEAGDFVHVRKALLLR